MILLACAVRALQEYQRKCNRIRLQFAAAVIGFTVITIVIEQFVTGVWWLGFPNVGVQVANAAVTFIRWRRAYNKMIGQTCRIALLSIALVMPEAEE